MKAKDPPAEKAIDPPAKKAKPTPKKDVTPKKRPAEKPKEAPVPAKQAKGAAGSRAKQKHVIDSDSDDDFEVDFEVLTSVLYSMCNLSDIMPAVATIIHGRWIMYRLSGQDVKDKDVVVDLLGDDSDDDSEWEVEREPAKPAAKKESGSRAKPPSQRAAPAAAAGEEAKPAAKPAKKPPATPRVRPPSGAKCALQLLHQLATRRALFGLCCMAASSLISHWKPNGTATQAVYHGLRGKWHTCTVLGQATCRPSALT